MLRSRGFTLVEMAVVLVVIGLLVAGFLLPASTQMDIARVRHTTESLDELNEVLVGFAIANERLPCPATPASAGTEAVAGGGCTAQHGFIPAATLGVDGRRNADGLLTDEWGSPYRYSVSNADADADGDWDFVVAGEMRDVQIANLTPDLVICTTTAGSSATACADAATTIAANVPALVYSMGKDWATATSSEQTENAGATLGGGPSGVSYAVAADVVFVDRDFGSAAGSEYDDILTWNAPGTLYNRLVSAGRLP